MSPTASSNQPEFFRSPLWGGLLDRTEAELSAAPTTRARSRAALIEAAVEAAGSGSRLLVALDGAPSVGSDLVSESVADAVRLMLVVAALRQTANRRCGDQRAELVEQLRRRLSAHEDGVLAGEITYAMRLEEAEQAALALRHAIARVSGDERTRASDLVSLRLASVDLAALLVLAAANAAASGTASEAPEQRTAALDRTLRKTTRELAARAQEVELPVDARGDVVAHHLAAALRVRVAQETLDCLAASSASAEADTACLDEAREAWLRLATNEYVAVTALDDQLEIPTYEETFGTLDRAIETGAANVICGGRLLSRPGAFRHRRAWGHHAIGLTYALEAYVAGLRGDTPSFAQAQLIALTRLIRATASIAVIELRRADVLPSNGSSKL
jgi:hypothetical protein